MFGITSTQRERGVHPVSSIKTSLISSRLFPIQDRRSNTKPDLETCSVFDLLSSIGKKRRGEERSYNT